MSRSDDSASSDPATTEPASTDAVLEQRMLELLDRTVPGRTICPSDVARSVAPDSWRPLMEPTRAVARRLVAAGRAEITQRGEVVDPSTAKGPIRIRPVR